jgi:uncharacterized protein YcfJ
MKAVVFGAAVLGLALAACASAPNVVNNPTVKGAAVGAATGAVAGAVIGNNTGDGDAGRGAAIGAVVGGVAGGVIGNRQGAAQQQQQAQGQAQGNVTGPRGEPVTWDPTAKKYYYTDSLTGVQVWLDGSRR